MDAIDKNGSSILEGMFSDAEGQGLGDAVREVWLTDKRKLKEEFDKDQTRNCELCSYRFFLSFCLYNV